MLKSVAQFMNMASRRWGKPVLLSCLLFSLCACQNVAPVHESQNAENLNKLMSMSTSSAFINFRGDLSEVRSAGLREIGHSAGAQAGLAWQAEQYNSLLKTNTAELDAIFNFNALVLDNGVLPPVIVEGRKSWNVADEYAQTIRVAEKTYVIEQQARFSGTVPNWRDYLWMDYSKPETPNTALLPRNRQEQKVWKTAVKEGWEKGIEQAGKIYDTNLARLKHDMEGMLLYRKLLAQRIVSAPFIAKSNLGVTGGGERLNINDQVLRITNQPSLQADSERWDPAVGK